VFALVSLAHQSLEFSSLSILSDPFYHGFHGSRYDVESIMKEIYSTIAFELAGGERIGIRVRRGEFLQASGERLWVTRSNDQADYFLHDGDTLALRPDETLWLSVDGLRTARLMVTLKAGTRGQLVSWLGDWLTRTQAAVCSGPGFGVRIG
jgi:hypothetical protein